MITPWYLAGAALTLLGFILSNYKTSTMHDADVVPAGIDKLLMTPSPHAGDSRSGYDTEDLDQAMQDALGDLSDSPFYGATRGQQEIAHDGTLDSLVITTES